MNEADSLSFHDDLAAAFTILARMREEKGAYLRLEELEPGLRSPGGERWLLWFDMMDGHTSRSFYGHTILDAAREAESALLT